jgi:hypothetical protein
MPENEGDEDSTGMGMVPAGKALSDGQEPDNPRKRPAFIKPRAL